MKNILPENILLQLSEFIAFNLALNFPKERWNDLERKIVSAAKEFGYQDSVRFIKHIMSSPLTREHSDILASYLTIKETYFWREPQSFAALEQKILPELIHLRKKREKRIRIWSAGCSTGEEPYSIAIALRRLIPDIDKWNITILASDINPENLQKANAGVYSQWSFRNTPEWLKEKYFLPAGKGKFEILSEIKSMVRFEYLNLAKDIFPSPINNTNAMDIIFCRNVLMYFTREHFGQAVNGLFNSLVEGGYLMVGACELSTQNFPQFESVNFPGVIVYRKSGRDSYRTSGVGFEEKPEPAVVMELSLTQFRPLPIEILQPVEIKLPEPSNFQEALSLFSQGFYTEVIDKFEKHALTSEEYLLLVRTFINLGKLSDAIAICEKVIATDRLDPQMHYLYATILQENNQVNEAIASHKHAIYLDPDFVLSYYSLGSIFLRQGNLPEAKKCYRNILAIIDECSNDEILPESEGLTAGRFREIINATIQSRAL